MTTVEKIDRILNDCGMSRRRLAISCGIPPTTLQSYMEDYTKTIPANMIEKIVNALGVSYESVIDDAVLALQYKTQEEFAKGILLGCTAYRDKNLQDNELICAFRKLNTKGKKEAVKRINELIRLPEYTEE